MRQLRSRTNGSPGISSCQRSTAQQRAIVDTRCRGLSPASLFEPSPCTPSAKRLVQQILPDPWSVALLSPIPYRSAQTLARPVPRHHAVPSRSVRSCRRSNGVSAQGFQALPTVKSKSINLSVVGIQTCQRSQTGQATSMGSDSSKSSSRIDTRRPVLGQIAVIGNLVAVFMVRIPTKASTAPMSSSRSGYRALPPARQGRTIPKALRPFGGRCHRHPPRVG